MKKEATAPMVLKCGSGLCGIGLYHDKFSGVSVFAPLNDFVGPRAKCGLTAELEKPCTETMYIKFNDMRIVSRV